MGRRGGSLYFPLTPPVRSGTNRAVAQTEERTEQAKTWLEPSLYQRLQALAAVQGRSVSGQLRMIVKERLDREPAEDAA